MATVHLSLTKNTHLTFPFCSGERPAKRKQLNVLNNGILSCDNVEELGTIIYN